MQTTLILLKPDTVQRALVGELLARFEAKGLTLAGMKLIQASEDLAKTHYAEHEGKPFFDGLIEFITGSPLVVLALRGVDAVPVARTLIGATNGRKADPGTIRGDFGMSGGYNLVHGSDSAESAERELKLWFSDGELLDWMPQRQSFVYDPGDL